MKMKTTCLLIAAFILISFTVPKGNAANSVDSAGLAEAKNIIENNEKFVLKNLKAIKEKNDIIQKNWIKWKGYKGIDKIREQLKKIRQNVINAERASGTIYNYADKHNYNKAKYKNLKDYLTIVKMQYDRMMEYKYEKLESLNPGKNYIEYTDKAISLIK